MLIPMLATRLLARNVLASCRSFQRLPTLQIARTFSASSAVWARAAASKKSQAPKKTKPKARKITSKKRPTKKAAKKTRLATKKKAKKVPAKRKKSTTVKKIILRGRPDLKPPQKPGNPYLFFYRKYLAGQQRPEGIPIRDFLGRAAKESSVSWKALSEQEKQPFHDEYAVALAEYRKQFDEYMKNIDTSVLREINKRRKKNGKRKLAGKKFTNGFIIFGLEQRPKLKRPESCAQGASIMQELAKNWQALATQEKLSYTKLAQERNAALSKQ